MARRAAALVAAAALALLALGTTWALGDDGMGGSPSGMPSASPGATSSGMDMGGMDMGGMDTTQDLQTAIDRASPGDVVHVAPGTYHGNFVVDRTLTLDGMGAAILDAGGAGSVLTITAPGVAVHGLALRNSGKGPVGQPAGIVVEHADGVLIEDVTIEHTYAGIVVRGATGTTITGSRILGTPNAAITGEMHAVGGGEMPGMDHSMGASATTRGDGVSLWNCERTTVRGNEIRDVRDGVYVSFGSGITVEGNHIVDSRYAMHTMYPQEFTATGNVLDGNLNGVVLMYGGPSRIEGNTILHSGSPSTGFGVLVKDAGSVSIVRNVIVDNRVGIHVDNGSATAGGPTDVLANTIAMNQVGVEVVPSTRATFSENGFIENTAQVVMAGSGGSGSVFWTRDGRGNYWTTYQGYDVAGDGIGDVPYTESGHLDSLLVREPVLVALASGPALRLLSAVEDRWMPGGAVVSDTHPLTRPVSPMLRGGAADRPTIPLWVPGALATALCGFVVAAGRRPRRRRVLHAA